MSFSTTIMRAPKFLAFRINCTLLLHLFSAFFFFSVLFQFLLVLFILLLLVAERVVETPAQYFSNIVVNNKIILIGVAR